MSAAVRSATSETPGWLPDGTQVAAALLERKMMEVVEGHIAIDPPRGVPVWEVDPYDPSVLSAPEGYYTELRAKGPFAYLPKYGALACGR